MKRYVFPLAVVLLSGLLASGASPQQVPPKVAVDLMPAAVVKAVLAEEWKQVADLVTEDLCGRSAVARLIKGHACLNENRNNESACLFLSATEKSHLEAWDAWTSEFHKAHPASAPARYFKGDALARLGQYEPALRILEAALKDAPSHVLVLNALGVIQARRGELRTARVFFQDAARQRRPPALADAYANIAALRIQQKEGPEGALSALNTAVDISPNFALALHSRACIHLIMRKPASAKEDFSKAAGAGPCGGLSSLFAQNVLKAQAYWAGLSEQELLARLSEEKAGTTIRATVNPQQQFQTAMSTFNDWMQNPTQGNLNRFNGALTRLNDVNPTLASNMLQGAQRTLAANPGKASLYNSQVGVQIQTNSRFGFAETFAEHVHAISTTTGSLAGASLGGGAAGGALGGLAGHLVGQTAKQSIGIMSQRSLDTATRMQAIVPPGIPSGGVDASFDRARWDEGEWPFVAYYGLFYP